MIFLSENTSFARFAKLVVAFFVGIPSLPTIVTAILDKAHESSTDQSQTNIPSSPCARDHIEVVFNVWRVFQSLLNLYPAHRFIKHNQG